MKTIKKLLVPVLFAGMIISATPSKSLASVHYTVTDTASQSFVTKAAEGGMMEVEAGKLASKNAGSARVKAFGIKMIADHTKANMELKAIAIPKGYMLPAAAPKTHLSMMVGQKGAAFDKAYISMMVSDHDKTIALFEKAASSLPDLKLRAFAAKTLPVLKEHKRLVLAIATALGV